MIIEYQRKEQLKTRKRVAEMHFNLFAIAVRVTFSALNNEGARTALVSFVYFPGVDTPGYHTYIPSGLGL